jgi:hypothetical protein
MGARLVVAFCDERKRVEACVYDHWAADNRADAQRCLEDFFEAVKAQCADTRFTDAPYLAAKFVVWRANRYAASEQKRSANPDEARPLNFLSVGVVTSETACGPEWIVRVHPPAPGEALPRIEHVGKPDR